MRKSSVVVLLGISIWGCREQPVLRTVHATIEVEGKLDFGETLLGTSKTIALDVSNTGDDVLRICVEGTEHTRCAGQASGIRPEATPFTVAFDGLGEEKKAWNVEKGSTRQLFVTYTPVGEGPVGATLVLIHDGDNGPSSLVEVTGSSVGPRVQLSETSLDFGEVSVGQRKELTLTFTNETTFDTPLTLALEQQSTQNYGMVSEAGEVTANEPLMTSIPGDGSLTLTVWYRPQIEGEVPNNLAVSFCTNCNTTVPITGKGVKPVFTITPQNLDFGVVSEGTPVSDSFIVRNAGNVSMTVEAIAPDLQTTAEFSVATQGLPLVLAPGEQLTAAVTYVGVTPGTDSGNIEVRTNAWDDPATPTNEQIGLVAVLAQSNGPDIAAIPSTVSFGTVDLGTSSLRNVLIENNGNEPLNISAMDLNAGPEIIVDVAPSTPVTLNPGDSIAVTLRYSPTDTGMDTATLVVTSNDRDEMSLTIPLNGIGGVANACTVAVTPSNVQFGLVQPSRSVQLNVTVQSAGGQPCNLQNFSLSGDPELQIETAPTSMSLMPGESDSLTLSYTPTANGNHVSTLNFTSNDPAQAVVSVPVTGSSFPTDIVVSPPEVDFGVIPTNCQSTMRYVSIYNTGAQQETINSIFLANGASPELVLNPAGTPLTLPPGAQSTVSLRYRPTNIGADYGVLFIHHSAATVPVAVPLTGTSDPNAVATDTFSQQPSPADVLFVVDNSYSMMEEQTNLGQNLGAFLSFAQGQGVNYQIGITTTDTRPSPTGQAGELQGFTKIITPATPNKEQVFQSNVNVGINGAIDEMGLEAAYLALSPSNLAGPNAGFLRPGAILAIVIVSDEEDQSVDPNSGGYRPLSFYQNFFSSLKPNGSVIVSSIVGTTNPDCNSPDGIAYYGPRYITMAQNSGGVVASICSPSWGQNLANIGVRSFGLKKTFELTSQPVPATIAVTLDGNPTGAGAWTYDAVTNTINFAVEPPAYTQIEITYSVQCL